MAEAVQADAERLAELNRNKERHEEAEREQRAGQERQLQDDVRENSRRASLQEQREREEKNTRAEVEASAARIAENKRKHAEEEHRKAQATRESRKAEMRKERERSHDQDSNRMKTRAEKVEESEQRVAKANREKEVRAGRHDTSNLTAEEKGWVQDEVQQSAVRIKADRDKWKSQGRPSAAKTTYFKQTDAGTQIKDMLFGNKPWADEKKTKEVKPITTILGAQKYKAEQRLGAAKQNFLADLQRPVAGIQAGRERRAKKQEIIPDPFAGLTQSQQQARVRRHRPREGTGMLFSEGFFNPPARAPPKKGKKGRKPRATKQGLLDFNLDDMLL